MATVAASGNEVEKTDEVECACVRLYMYGMRDPSFEINFDKFFILLFLSRLDRSNLATFLVERSYCVGLYFHSIEMRTEENRGNGARNGVV